MGKPASSISAKSRAAVERRRAESRLHEILRHKRRCATLAPPTQAEVEASLATYRARGGAVTACPDAYAHPVQNGAGRDAQAWTA